MGRVLRRHRGASGEEKTSCIHVLYAADSSEDNIYGKLNTQNRVQTIARAQELKLM